MATDKQVNMLMARAKEAGVKGDRDAYKELENGDIDKKLEEFAQLKEKKTEVQTEVTQAPKGEKFGEVSGNNFGMAAKAVINADYMMIRQGHQPATDAMLIACIKEYYNILQEARAQLGSASTKETHNFAGQEVAK